MKGVFSILAFAAVIAALCLSAASKNVIGPIVAVFWVLAIAGGASGRAKKAKAHINKILMPGETLIADALQHRTFAFFNRRAMLAITSSRIIRVKRGLLGGFKMHDIQWKDLLNATIEENVMGDLCGSNLRFTHLSRTLFPIAVDGIPNDPASAMYAKAQFEEQAWEEKRRVRVMEEARAISGGVVVNAGGASGGASVNRLDEIAKAKALLDSGAVSDAEFQEMKAKILAG